MQSVSQVVSRKCIIADHQKVNVYHACVYPKCNTSRFLCAKCFQIENHKHSKEDNKHILDKNQLYEKLFVVYKERISMSNKQIHEFKELLKEVQILFENIKEILEVIKYGNQYTINNNQIKEILEQLKQSGLDHINNQELEIIINSDIKQKFAQQYQNIQQKTNLLIQQAIQIKSQCQIQQTNQEKLQKIIEDAKYTVFKIEESKIELHSLAISGDLKYISSGGRDKILKIWNYQDIQCIKQIEYQNSVYICKFTNDSKLLYVGSNCTLYQYDVQNQFKETFQQSIHQNCIFNIYCITNTVILTSSQDQTIVKTDTIGKQILFLIKAHTDRIDGLDFNYNFNLIASGSNDKFIKIWNGNNGIFILSQICEYGIFQVLLLQNKNQLISLDLTSICIIWDINYELNQLNYYKQINDNSFIYNISLTFDQQLLVITCQKYFKVYSVKAELKRTFFHSIQELIMFNTIQLDSMKAIAIRGKKEIEICKIEFKESDNDI